MSDPSMDRAQRQRDNMNDDDWRHVWEQQTVMDDILDEIYERKKDREIMHMIEIEEERIKTNAPKQ